MGLLHTFAGDISYHVSGVPHEDGLLQLIRPYQMEFRRAIRSTAPQFVPLESSAVSAGGFAMEKPKFLEQEGEIVEEEGDDESGI